MTRHNPAYRPPPRYDAAGRFLPSGPVPFPGTPEDWTFWDYVSNMRALSRNPIEATTRVSRERPFYKTKLLGQTLVLLADPDLIKTVFVTHHSNIVLNPIRNKILIPIVGKGLLTAEGESWKRARHMTAPVFTPRNITSFADHMSRDMQAAMGESFQDGAQIKLGEEMLKLAYDVLSGALFSHEIDAQGDIMLPNIATALSHMGNPDILDIIGAPDFIPRLSKLRGVKAVKRIREQIAALIAQRMARRDAGEPLPEDFITLLMHDGEDGQPPLTPAEIEDQLITFIGAGHETTSRAIAWMVYLLSQDIDIRGRVETEIDALNMDSPPQDWAAALPYTMACFNETMRLYPPAPFIGRQAVADFETSHVKIDKGDEILLNLWALHRHEQLWEQPDTFIPERFMGDAGKAIHRFAFLPFGLGPRVCIGQRFALQEAAILIALMLRSYRFDYTGTEAPWPVMRVTTQAENGIPMKVSKR